MGQSYGATCKPCGHTFVVSEGGGIFQELLHCTKCSETADVLHEDVRDAYLGYLKGMNNILPEMDGSDGQSYEGEPITRRQYRAAVEKKAGKCLCGGRFRYSARPRCPACASDDIFDNKTLRICYD